MNNLTMNILGFPAVNRDLKVEVREPLTQQVVRTVQPFLDGTVRVPKINPGNYEVRLLHPNLSLPVARRPVRVLPHGDTKVSILLDPSKFRDTPIEDIPDANLEPVRQLSDSVAESVASLAEKRPGEAILAEDWNQMASAIRDLAGAMGELTRLVSPQGHDHPEFVRKFDEVSDNFEILLDTLSKTLTEMQRQIETQRLRQQIEDVLDRASIDPVSSQGQDFLTVVDTVEALVTESPSQFARNFRLAGTQLETKLDQLVDLRQGQQDLDFINSEPVRALTDSIDLAKQQRSTTYAAELLHHRKETRRLVARPALLRR